MEENIIRKDIDITQPLTDEQLEMLKQAEAAPVVFDEDCPELTEEQLSEFRRIGKFYIADTHFGHKNILRFDGRPWFDLTSMQDDMIALWNKKVRKCDIVYILGDFCWGTADDWRKILPRLHGKKFLILGNHDLKQFPEDIRRMFVEITPFKEVHDGEYHITLSHYPMITYKHSSSPCSLMFYGHVHRSVEFEAVKRAVAAHKEYCEKNMFSYQGKLYNCWCGFYDYAPATLEEIINSRTNH